MAKTWKQTFGRWGESTAAAYLCEQGLEILERNYRCGYGEIDVIAQDGNTVVFVEVKTRSSAAFGLPEEAVDAAKQEHLLLSAENYLEENSVIDDWRMDVISILGRPDASENTEILWYKNAFDGS